jgi:hypothetical protein
MARRAKPARTTIRKVVDAGASRVGTTALSLSLIGGWLVVMWRRYSGLLCACLAAGSTVIADGDLERESAAPSCRIGNGTDGANHAPRGSWPSEDELRFDAQAKQSLCKIQYTDGRGGTTTSTTTTVYNSIADVIDEIAVIPPLSYAVTATATQTGNAGATSMGSVTNTFDGSRRMLKTVYKSAGGESTTTYTEWDKVGRPTRANDVGRGFNNSRVISYDDNARSRTTVVNGGPLRTVETFDVNGNQIETLATNGATAISTKTTVTIIASQRVCK